jgi:hypothetical protein
MLALATLAGVVVAVKVVEELKERKQELVRSEKVLTYHRAIKPYPEW